VSPSRCGTCRVRRWIAQIATTTNHGTLSGRPRHECDGTVRRDALSGHANTCSLDLGACDVPRSVPSPHTLRDPAQLPHDTEDSSPHEPRHGHADRHNDEGDTWVEAKPAVRSAALRFRVFRKDSEYQAGYHGQDRPGHEYPAECQRSSHERERATRRSRRTQELRSSIS